MALNMQFCVTKVYVTQKNELFSELNMLGNHVAKLRSRGSELREPLFFLGLLYDVGLMDITELLELLVQLFGIPRGRNISNEESALLEAVLL